MPGGGVMGQQTQVVPYIDDIVAQVETHRKFRT